MNRPTHTHRSSPRVCCYNSKKKTQAWCGSSPTQPCHSFKVLCEWKTTRYTSLCCGRLVVFNTPPLRCEHYVSSLSLPVRMYQLPHTRYKQVDTCTDLHGISDLLIADAMLYKRPKTTSNKCTFKSAFFFFVKRWPYSLIYSLCTSITKILP